MNWIIVGIISIIGFIILGLFIFISNKQSNLKLFEINLRKLKDCLRRNIFEYEKIFKYDFYECQIRFGNTKEILLNKCNEVYSIMCNMINLYKVDNKIKQFYDTQLKNLQNQIDYIERELEIYAKTKEKSEDFELNESYKVCFNKLNNGLNKTISDFIIGNAEFYTKLKFYNSKQKNNKISYKEIQKSQNKVTVIKYIISFFTALGIGILVNFICKLIGV